MTLRDQDSALASTLLPVLESYGLERDPTLIRDLVGAVSGLVAQRIEEACRPYPWPPVRRRERGEPEKQRKESA